MERARANDIVTEEGYTIAPFLLRIAAATVDMAFVVAVTVLMFFLVYPFGMFPTLGDALGVSEANQIVSSLKLESGLFTDELGLVSYRAYSSYEGYEATLKTYYLEYQKEGNANNPEPKCYTISDYNTKVLYLPTSVDFIVDSPYFDWYRDELGNPDASRIGVIKPSLLNAQGELSEDTKENLLYFFQARYQNAVEEFENEPYIVSAQTKSTTLTVILELVAVLPAFSVFYIVIPLCDKTTRKTLGKRFMKLATIHRKGKILPWYMVLLRGVPFIATIVTAVLLDELVATLAVAVSVFLISMAVATFSPHRRAVHDYLASSVVARHNETLFSVEEEEKK